MKPKAMKAKADKMLRSGAISEKEHKRLHAKADAVAGSSAEGDLEGAPVADKVKGGIGAQKGAGTTPGNDTEGYGKLSARPRKDAPLKGADTAKADDPSGRFRKRGSDQVMRGQPLDEEEEYQ